MKPFPKRIYHSFREFMEDFRFIFRNRNKLKEINQGSIISHSFRQRLMLAVTVVNGCRYCTYYHTRLSLKVGVRSDELQALLSGELRDSPEDELFALLYAQHWAENNANPDPDYQQKLFDTYGEKRAEDIELILKTIRFGNLSGNSFDYILYRLTFGVIGLPKGKTKKKHL